jgi:hypothetical protein
VKQDNELVELDESLERVHPTDGQCKEIDEH